MRWERRAKKSLDIKKLRSWHLYGLHWCFFGSLFRSKPLIVQITVRVAMGKMKYFTLSPGFPLLCFCWTSFHRLSTSTVCAPLREHTLRNVHMHAHRHRHVPKPKKKQNTKREETWFFLDKFKCVLLYIMPHPHPRQETGSLEQGVMWHFAEAFFCCARHLIWKLT